MYWGAIESDLENTDNWQWWCGGKRSRRPGFTPWEEVEEMEAGEEDVVASLQLLEEDIILSDEEKSYIITFIILFIEEWLHFT